MFTFKKLAQHFALAGALASTLGLAVAHADDDLTIGSTAPALDVEHWVQNGNGKFKPVKEFNKGKVYVVEFWATWCGPCIGSMPHLVEIQNKFADKGVQIISISNEDLETVEKFLEREFKGGAAKEEDDSKEAKDQPKTYRDLTSAYCLTTDPDGSSDKSYMEAAGQNGIPCAFIVGKDQKIEWIGHPMQMDAVLEQVVSDSWDRDAFAEKFKVEQQMNLLMSKIMRASRGGNTDAAMKLIDEALASADSDQMKQQLMQMRISILMQTGKSAEALTALDEMIESQKNPDAKAQMNMVRVQIVLQDLKNPKLPEIVMSAYEDYQDNPSFINFISWNLYEKFKSGELENKELLKASRAAAEKAAKAADGASKAAIMDTAAHYQYLDGDKAAAIATQEAAIKLADDQLKGQLEDFLEELKSDK